MGISLKVDNVIISWPSLGKPQSSARYPANPPKFKVDCIITDPAELKKVQDIVAQLKAENFPHREPNHCFLKETSMKIEYPPQNFKGGNICNVQVDAYASTNNGTISIKLEVVQWADEGSPIGPGAGANSRPDTSAFAPMPVKKFDPPTAEGFKLT